MSMLEEYAVCNGINATYIFQGDILMRKKVSKIIYSCVAFSLLVSIFSGCTSSTSEKDVNKANDTTTLTENYPLKTDVTLKYWMILHNNVAQVTKNFGELPIAKKFEEETGVKVEYIHPPAGQERDAFSIMVASGNLPDIIEYNWLKYPGGPNNAIKSDVIITLDDVYKKSAPNLSKYLQKNPEIDKMVKTDEGHYYMFPFLRPDEELLVTFGPVIRKDWLDDLGLKAPETLDDWHEMLKAFKEKKNAVAPLTATVKMDDDRNTKFSEVIKLFAGATESYQDFYIDNGKVKFGPIEPNRKKFFEVMAKWYAEGLIDKNFSTADNKAQDSNMLNGKSGATACSGGSGLGKWLVAGKSKDPKYDLVAVSYPSARKGEKSKFGVRSLEYAGPGCAAITAKCKNVDVAAKYLDFMYGEKGHMLINFGIEGESYSIVNNNPVYTDLIMENPDKLPVTSAMSKYMRGHTNGAFIQDKRYLEQYYVLPQQKEAVTKWSNTDQKKYRLLPITPTIDESSELSNIINEVNTYVDEMTLKFIMGKEPISKFDEYVEQVKNLHINRALDIYQAALDRYQKR